MEKLSNHSRPIDDISKHVEFRKKCSATCRDQTQSFVFDMLSTKYLYALIYGNSVAFDRQRSSCVLFGCLLALRIGFNFRATCFNQSEQTCCLFNQSRAKIAPLMTCIHSDFPRLMLGCMFFHWVIVYSITSICLVKFGVFALQHSFWSSFSRFMASSYILTLCVPTFRIHPPL